MNSEKYKGRRCRIKTQGTVAVIEDVTYRRGSGGALAARFVVVDTENKRHELMPHEIDIDEEAPMMGMSF